MSAAFHPFTYGAVPTLHPHILANMSTEDSSLAAKFVTAFKDFNEDMKLYDTVFFSERNDSNIYMFDKDGKPFGFYDRSNGSDYKALQMAKLELHRCDKITNEELNPEAVANATAQFEVGE